jgi:hypothetical protein
MYTQEPPIYIPMKLAVSCHRSAHDKVFTKSRILSDAVPLGFCCGGFSSTAGYEPGNEAQLSLSRLPPLAGPLPKGTTRFRVARESLATFSS